MKLRSLYDGKQKEYSQAASLSKFEETLTEQAHKDSCDINILLRRMDAGTLNLQNLIKQNPTYADFSAMPEYQQALEVVRVAGEQFAALDGKIRARFENDPSKFLEFVHNPENAKELVQLGLATERKPEDTTSLGDVVKAVNGLKPSSEPKKGKSQQQQQEQQDE